MKNLLIILFFVIVKAGLTQESYSLEKEFSDSLQILQEQYQTYLNNHHGEKKLTPFEKKIITDSIEVMEKRIIDFQIFVKNELERLNGLESFKYSYDVDCQCFSEAFNLGELELNIKIEKQDGVYIGVVTDKSTGEIMKDVLIYSVNKKGDKIYPEKELLRTNSKGEFVIEMEYDELNVMFYYLSYVSNYFELKK